MLNDCPSKRLNRKDYILTAAPPTARPRVKVKVEIAYHTPLSETRRSLDEGDDSTGWDVDAGSSLATTVTTSGVAIELELVLVLDPLDDREALPEPDLEVEVDGVEDVGEGVAPSEVYPGGKVDTFGIVVEPVDVVAAPASAANPTAGGSNR